MNKFYIDVSVLVPLKRNFLYLPLKNTSISDYQIGARVFVPFGSKRKIIGIITNIFQSDNKLKADNIAENKLKVIDEILDSNAILEPSLIKLAFWMAEYYFAPIGEVFALFLPKQLSEEEVF